ncbi:peptidoglycan-binding protein [Pseudoxanthomonas composti]|uniref:Peptidase M23 n=1 Tax=Pseudoxanthomonas composti TaxID=2137479 RepID=A0A4Q1JSJ6_9GAMM|nr:peptidoglycan-binding protein [Pseudoxanthomonas composti]RXR02711.1 peptidase M23 [Pseudoxanthomonas composti]
MATDRENGLLQSAYAAGITSQTELANFMAQVGHESGGLNRLEESFNYTRGASQISSLVRSALREGPEALEAARLEALRGQPQRLAELMYGGRMGNDEPGDGYRYRGRGYIQLTGKDQYREAGQALDLDLVRHPELAARPENAARIATWYWQNNVPEAARDDARQAGAAINGRDPPNGLADRERRFDQWERDLTPELMRTLSEGRLGQPVPAAARQQEAATVQSNFQQTMERMLPGQNGVDPHITGQYGERRSNGAHGGTDFNYEGGQSGRNLQHPTVHAPISGTVTFSGGQYGTVKIQDAQGNSHEILHLDSRSVREGQTIQAGDPIGTMGGRGPRGGDQYAQHVHYQLRDPSGKLISPQTWWDQGRSVEVGAQSHGQDDHRGHGHGEVLRHGDRGEGVRSLQQQLNQLGVRDADGRRLAEDGKFGDNTREAVLAYQQAHGLKQDGIVGRATHGSLEQQSQERAAASRTPQAQPILLDDSRHPNNPLYGAIRGQLPTPYSNDAAAAVTAQAIKAGIDSPDKLQGVVVKDNTAFVIGNTPGFRASVDLSQQVPTAQQSSIDLLTAERAAQQQDPQQQMGARAR